MDNTLPPPSINPEDKNDNMAEDDQIGNLEPPLPNAEIINQDAIVSLKKGEAKVEENDGKSQLQYMFSKDCRVESQTNTICGPEHVKGCLDLLHFLTSGKPPCGTVFDKIEISLSKENLYRNGVEFKSTNKILGIGSATIGHKVVVVKDEKTGREHGLKTVMISTSAENEVRCWIDLKDSGHVPRMFLFQFVNNKIEIHMEIIKGKTLRSIMDKYMFILRDAHHRHLVKPFSLHVLEGSLKAISAMHEKGWTHNDVHGGNLMLDTVDSDMRVKVIDFGRAKKFEENAKVADYEQHTKEILKDFKEALRVFSGLYTTNEFKDMKDFEQNYKNAFDHMDEDDKYEIINLIDIAVMYGNINKLRSVVSTQLNNVLNESGLHREQFLEDVAKLVLPERFRQLRLSEQVQKMETDEGSGEQCGTSPDLKVVAIKQCRTYPDFKVTASKQCGASPDIDGVAASKLLAEIRGKYGIGQL